MRISLGILSFLMVFFFSDLKAQEPGCPPGCTNVFNECWCQNRPFLYVGTGLAFSTHSSIHVDTNYWEASPEGYDDRLHSSEFYTLGLGYHLNSAFSLMFEATYRPHFRYEKFQTSTAVDTPGFLGTKTRHFRLQNIAFLVDAFFNKQGELFSFGFPKCACVAPFAGVGVGVSYNRLSDFHSITPPISDIYNESHLIMTEFTRTSWAAQAILGLVTRINPCLTFEIAYRRFYGGRFATNDYFVDVPPGLITPIEVHPWKGTLQSNELVVGFCFTL